MTQPSLCQRFGEHRDVQVLLFEPLFEEANRTRRLIAQMGRALDERGIGLIVACLTGSGESAAPSEQISLGAWRADAAGLSKEFAPAVVASLRGGALIDDAAPARGCWRFAPETGARIVRDLRRTRASGDPNLYAGNALNSAFLEDLEKAAPAPLPRLRTVRLDTDAGEADAVVSGAPLWRRAEPGEDAALAIALATDLANWVRQCVA